MKYSLPVVSHGIITGNINSRNVGNISMVVENVSQYFLQVILVKLTQLYVYIYLYSRFLYQFSFIHSTYQGNVCYEYNDDDSIILPQDVKSNSVIECDGITSFN